MVMSENTQISATDHWPLATGRAVSAKHVDKGRWQTVAIMSAHISATATDKGCDSILNSLRNIANGIPHTDI